MRCVVQRVKEASVTVDGEIVGKTGPGILALIAWGVVPWLTAKKKREAAAASAEAARIAAEQQRLNEPKLCPACGATTKGLRCEYCGTPLK